MSVTSKNNISEKIKKNIKEATIGQWIKAGIVVLVYILFIIWVSNFWWLLLTPVFFDVYITKIIPWSWWKNIKNKTLRTLMAWVDAIVFALVAVYFVFAFLFQNYQIPTSSLEKTLLVGDFLFVSKAHYGPRVPMTPLSFPLAQHTMPGSNTKSYIECPQWEYRRLKGITSIKRDDIVVFNFPTGDTVALKQQNPDFYTLCHQYGRERVMTDKRTFGEIVYRPVDRRENYVKRCVGLPGDTFLMVNNQVYINGKAQEHHKGIQHNYFVQTNGTLLNNKFFQNLGVSKEDIAEYAQGIRVDIASLIDFNDNLPVYSVPLTQEMKQQLEDTKEINKIAVEPVINDINDGKIFPLDAEYGWDRDNYGPLYIPRAGDKLKLTIENLPIYNRIISVYEHNKLEVRDSVIYINDVATDTYNVKMDYYWMLGDNRHRSADSRYWGFVPEDHVVGCPLFVWFSWDKDKKGVRFNRFFKNARR